MRALRSCYDKSGLHEILSDMAARSFAIALVAFMVFCTVLLLIWPVAWGPYSATHGPVTALRAMRSSVILMLGMLLAATCLTKISLAPALLRNIDRSDSIRVRRDQTTGSPSSQMRC